MEKPSNLLQNVLVKIFSMKATMCFSTLQLTDIKKTSITRQFVIVECARHQLNCLLSISRMLISDSTCKSAFWSEECETVLDEFTKNNNNVSSNSYPGYDNLVDEDLYSYPIMNHPVFYLDVEGLKVEKKKNTDISFQPDSSFRNRPLPELPSSSLLKLPNRRRKSVFTNSITAWTLCLFVLIVLLCGAAELGYSIFCNSHSSNSTSSQATVGNETDSGRDSLDVATMKTSAKASSSKTTTSGIIEDLLTRSVKPGVKKCTKKHHKTTTTEKSASVSTSANGSTIPSIDNGPEYVIVKIKPKSVNRLSDGWYIVL